MNKPPFSWLPLAHLWTFDTGVLASLSIGGIYGSSKAAEGGQWGLSDQEFVERWTNALKTLPLVCRQAAAGQSILESGWFRSRVLFGVKTPADFGTKDWLGIDTFHPTLQGQTSATTEFTSQGVLYNTSSTFVAGSIEDQMAAYVSNIQRVHPDALGLKDPKEYIHRICTPVNGFRKAYSTAPWVDPKTQVPIPEAGSWTWEEAWKKVGDGVVVSLYYLSVQAIIDAHFLEVFDQ